MSVVMQDAERVILEYVYKRLCEGGFIDTSKKVRSCTFLYDGLMILAPQNTTALRPMARRPHSEILDNFLATVTQEIQTVFGISLPVVQKPMPKPLANKELIPKRDVRREDMSLLPFRTSDLCGRNTFSRRLEYLERYFFMSKKSTSCTCYHRDQLPNNWGCWHYSTSDLSNVLPSISKGLVPTEFNIDKPQAPTEWKRVPLPTLLSMSDYRYNITFNSSKPLLYSKSGFHPRSLLVNNCPPWNLDPEARLELIPEDVELFDHYLTHVLCSGEMPTARYLRQWMARVVRKDTRNTTLLTLGGDPGTGKSTFISVLRKILSDELTANITGHGPLLTPFNGFMSHKKLLVIEELNTKIPSVRMDVEDQLKDLCTNETVSIHVKGQTRRTEDNFLSLIVSTNYPDGLPAMPRRHFSVNPKNPMSVDYYPLQHQMPYRAPPGH